VYFIVLNAILNFVYRLSPVLGLVLFIGYIVFVFSSMFKRQRVYQGYTSHNSTRKNPSSFKKDPNVIDAEFTEHKPTDFH